MDVVQVAAAAAAGAVVGAAVHVPVRLLTVAHPPKDGGAAPPPVPVPAPTVAGAVTGGLWALLPLPVWTVVLLVVVAVVVWAGALVDVRTRRIPNVLTHPAVVAGAVVAAAGATAGAAGAVDGVSAVGAVVGLLAPPLVLLVLRAGMGDVKLSVLPGVVVGLLFGWAGPAALLLAMAVSGAVTALVLVVAGKASVAARVPYGPHIAVAFVAAPFVAGLG